MAEIFRRIGITDSTLVEIGASGGQENCTRALVERGWRGVWVEGDADDAEEARRVVAGRDVSVTCAFIDRDNVAEVVREAGAPPEPDLLVIDVDGNDYWVWESLQEALTPRLVVIEYNAQLGPWLRWTLPHDARHRWDHDVHHGASLRALTHLGHRLGYQLVGCDSRGVNAFFVRDALAGSFPGLSVGGHFAPPLHRLPAGHPWAHRKLTTCPVSRGQDVQLGDPWCEGRNLRPGHPVFVTATLTNRTSVRVGSDPPAPVNMTWQWIDDQGCPVPGDDGDLEPTRDVMRQWWADPGTEVGLVARPVAPRRPGPYTLRLRLVQEDVCWFGDAATLELEGFTVS